LARGGVPHLQRAVPAAADDAFAVGAERHAVDRARVPPESELAVVARPEVAKLPPPQVPLGPVQDLQGAGAVAVLPFALGLCQLPGIQRQLRAPQLLLRTLLLAYSGLLLVLRRFACRLGRVLLVLRGLAGS